VSDQDQLQWEARLGRPVAVFAFAAGLLLLAGTFVLQSIVDDRPRVDALPDFLLSIDESPSTLLLSAGLQAISAICLIPVFYYLFRAIVHRSPGIPKWFVYLIFIGPVFYAVGRLLGAIDRIDVAELFADRTSDVGDACPAIRGKAGETCAEDLLGDDVNPVAIALSLSGSVATAFMFVMLPLRARRAGLMSQFMGILGVVAGALLVLQLMPLVPEIVQAFWLGAAGALVLGNWPGGRGPAWETGRPDPWPSAAERRGLVPAGEADEGGGSPGGAGGAAAGKAAAGANGAGGEPGTLPETGTPPEPEAAPQRPSSRKRRRKRR
jgi:hypothetical protein